MQEEVPKEQAWQGGIRFERTCKDFGHSVMLCMCSSFLLLYLVCFCLSLEWLKRCFPLNISEFAGRGQREEFGVLHCIGQVLFMRILCLRSSSPSATFSKTREPEDIRASISSAGEALQEEIERHARGNHSGTTQFTFSKMFLLPICALAFFAALLLLLQGHT